MLGAGRRGDCCCPRWEVLVPQTRVVAVGVAVGEGNLGTSPRLLVGEPEKEQSRVMSNFSLSSWGDGVPKDREFRQEVTGGAGTGNRVEEGCAPA